MAFFSVPDLVAAITARPGRSKSRHRAAACTRGVDNELAAARGCGRRASPISCGGHIRPDKIEFVFDAIKGAVSDKDERESRLRVWLSRATGNQRSRSCAAVALCARQRRDVRRRPFGLEDPIEIVGRGGKTLLIIRLAAEAGDNHVVRGRARLSASSAQTMPQ